VLIIGVIYGVKSAAGVVIFPTERRASSNSPIILIFDPTHYVNLTIPTLEDVIGLPLAELSIALEWQWMRRAGGNGHLKRNAVSAFVGALHRQRDICPENLAKDFFDVSRRPADIRHIALSVHEAIRGEHGSEKALPLGGMHYDIANAQPWPVNGDDLRARQIDALSGQGSLPFRRAGQADSKPCDRGCGDGADEHAVLVKENARALEGDLKRAPPAYSDWCRGFLLCARLRIAERKEILSQPHRGAK
jgi:hypothetical protein